MEYPWGHQRRFNAYAQYFKKQFGERVQKLTLDAGFTCPNRDGTVAKGGCTYCNNDAFNPSYNVASKPIQQQLLEGIEFHQNRYRRASKYLAYFQAYSNTYKPLSELKEMYDKALEIDGVIGIVVGTRSDCIDEEKLEYFARLAEEKYVIIEYGIESCYDKTLEKINRGHDFENVVKALELTKKYGLKTGGHMIFGLPGESKEEMLAEAAILSDLPLDNVKFHQLQIVKGTKMVIDYKRNPEEFSFFELEEYIDFIVNFVEQLNPKFVIERFAGEVPPRFQRGPNWGSIRNDAVLQKIERELEKRDSWQGKFFSH